MTVATIPLFPLNTVLFPGGPLPLRIFETRYLDMVSRCLRDDGEFGVVLIVDGSEVGAVQTAAVGTRARIVDWYQGEDGLLGITARGGGRFRVRARHRQADGLYLGDVDELPGDAAIELPPEFRALAGLVERVLKDYGEWYAPADNRPGDAAWVAGRLAEILPIPLPDKQRCLELDDPLDRLRLLAPLLRRLGESGPGAGH